jgi:glycosyltransferase involved in cell wall biosynthesis
MKIAILSTPWIAVPPVGYGGIELVVSNLAEGLVKRGHDVTLFATGDSKTQGNLQYIHKEALGNNLLKKSNPYYMLEHIHAFMRYVESHPVDIIHNNSQYIPQFFLDLFSKTPFVHTLHGAFYKDLESPSGNIPEIRRVLTSFKNHHYVSISDYQRTALQELDYVATVYNGINPDEFSFCSENRGYLVWLGRVTKNKGVDTAIKVAKKIGMPLKIGAFVDQGDKQYFDETIRPLLDDNVQFIGEVTDNEQKSKLLGEASAFLFPIRWHEPFGLVMVEAMACGTPVIAFNKGSVSEIIEDGKTGFIVENEDEMVQAVGKINTIDRAECRKQVLSKFTVDHMVDGYIDAYQKVVSK